MPAPLSSAAAHSDNSTTVGAAAARVLASALLLLASAVDTGTDAAARSLEALGEVATTMRSVSLLHPAVLLLRSRSVRERWHDATHRHMLHGATHRHMLHGAVCDTCGGVGLGGRARCEMPTWREPCRCLPVPS